MNIQEAIGQVANNTNKIVYGVVPVTINSVTYQFTGGYDQLKELDNIYEIGRGKKVTTINFTDINTKYSKPIREFRDVILKYNAILDTVTSSKTDKIERIRAAIDDAARDVIVAESFPVLDYTGELIDPNDIKFKTLEDGVVPKPTIIAGKFLKDDGTWATPTSGFGDPEAQIFFNGMLKFAKTHWGRGGAWINNDPLEGSEWTMPKVVDLMSWEVKGDANGEFKEVAGAHLDTASDGDLDIAYSLLLAHYQWGSSGTINYSTEATNRISAIMTHDVEATRKRIALGSWASHDLATNNKYYMNSRSSDWHFSSFKSFFDFTSNANWNTVITECKTMLSAVQNATTGLIPDFVHKVATVRVPSTKATPWHETEWDGDFYYNACRTPWRLAMGWGHSGDTVLKTSVEKFMDWLTVKIGGNIDNMTNGYTLTGTSIVDPADPDKIAIAFSAPVMVACTVNAAKYQTLLNTLWDRIRVYDAAKGYYDNSLALVCMLYVSGNWWIPTGNTGLRGFPYLATGVNIAKPSNYTQMELNNHVMSFYESWKKDFLRPAKSTTDAYYISATGTGGTAELITHSEAHGYGMLIFALMAQNKLGNFTTTTSGLVPAPGTSSGKVLSDNGSWITPAGGGGGSVATYNNNDLLTSTTTSLNFGRGLDARVTGNDVRVSINPFNYIWYIEDFLEYLVGSRLFSGTVISSGTMAAATAVLDDGKHPGIVRISSSTSANSGGRLMTGATSILLRGGYKFRAVVRFPSITTSTIRMGFIDTTSSADCVDGLYFEILAGVATFKTSSNSSRTSSSSQYTVAINNWYEIRIEFTVANTAIGSILSETGTVLFTSNAISTTLPTASGRQTGCGIIYTNSETSATEGVQIDYLAMQVPESTATYRQMW